MAGPSPPPPLPYLVARPLKKIPFLRHPNNLLELYRLNKVYRKCQFNILFLTSDFYAFYKIKQ